MNYAAAVVATIPSPTQFTASAGPGGNLPNTTFGAVAGSGFVYHRSALGFAENGTSMIFENVTAANAALYVRSEAGDALPSGTAIGNHSAIVGTTASVQAVNAPYTYAFQPTTEYKLALMADRLQWSDAPVDTVAAATNRLARSQVVPDPAALYKLRFRSTNNASLTVPTAQIVSVTKTGTATATIVFDRPHGLTVLDFIVAYGVRDQVNFANLTAATAVASVVNANTITVVWGAAVAATSYGGYAARVEGQALIQGQNVVVCSTATLAGGILTLVGNVNWAGIAIGDYMNAIGVRNALNGATLGVDGAYRVRTVATTVLELERIDGVAQPADFAATNCGGTVIKRTDMRVSFVRVFDFERERVEIMARPSADLASALPVAVQGGAVGANQSGAWNMTSAGTPAAPATPYFLNSAATTNGALIITGTSGLSSFYATNTGAAAAFVKLYNKATAPVVGTDVPEMVIPVPAAAGGVPGRADIDCGFNCHRFALGLGIAITGGAADADVTAVAAGQVKVKLSRTV